MNNIDIYYRSIRDSHVKELRTPRKGSWLNIISYDTDRLRRIASELNLDSDLLADAADLYESPRIERRGEATYIFVRYCEPSGRISSTEPLLIVSTPDFIITVARKSAIALEELAKSSDTITTQKIKLILQILTRINKDYRSHITGVTKHIFAARARLQKTIISNDDVLEFIDIEEDLNEFLGALQPYSILLHAFIKGRYFTLHEKDKDLIEDLELSTNELIGLSQSRLKTMQNIREAYTTIATNNLNKIFKRLTSITIFLMIPTIISGFYGMNVMLPADQNQHTFTALVLITSTTIFATILFFKKRRWL